MDPTRYRALRELLDRALELEIAERPRFVSEIDDRELRGDVALMLLRQAQPAVLDRPAAELLERTQTPELPFGRWAERQLGRRIGPYRLARVLGAGGMGTVYAAERADGRFAHTVAIKLVLAAYPGLHERFEREQRILAGLRHPHIAQLLDGGETEDGIPYLIMEYVEGVSISRFLAPLPAPPERVLQILDPVLDALAHAHREGVVHRDIKPSNIMCSSDGHVKLLDFGIAKLAGDEDEPDLTGQLLGPMTPAYAAPEQFTGGEIRATTDVYQFGVLAFELLTGRLPYSPATSDSLAWARAVAEEAPLSLPHALRSAPTGGAEGDGVGSAESHRTRLADAELARRLGMLSGPLDALVRHCLAKDPAGRYASMEELRADLARIRANDPVSPPRAPRAAPTPPSRAEHAAASSPSVAHAPPPRTARALRWSGALIAVFVMLGLFGLVALTALRLEAPSDDGARRAEATSAAATPLFDAAFGFRRGDLQTEVAETATLVERAYAAHNDGNRLRAISQLEVAHEGDRHSPVPALILAVWVAENGEVERAKQWLAQAHGRIGAASSAWVRSYERYAGAVVSRDGGRVLREIGALLDQRPDAWVLRYSRARTEVRRGDREAALGDLRAIEIRDLRLRQAAEVIADRASLGDLDGARALRATLAPEPENPSWHGLAGRLAYTAGDDAGALEAFRRAAELGVARQRPDWALRGRLLAAILAANAGETANAVAELGEVRLRYKDAGEPSMVVDTNLMLAQLMSADPAQGATRAALMDEAAALLPDESLEAVRMLGALVLLRLDPARAPVLAETADTLELRGFAALIEARQALTRGEREPARAAYRRALAENVRNTYARHEADLIARELGENVPAPVRIDPPIWPFARFAAGWAPAPGPGR